MNETPRIRPTIEQEITKELNKQIREALKLPTEEQQEEGIIKIRASITPTKATIKRMLTKIENIRERKVQTWETYEIETILKDMLFKRTAKENIIKTIKKK